MNFRTTLLAWGCSLGLSTVFAISCAQAAPAGTAPLVAALDRLEGRLAAEQAGPSWRRYLRLDQLRGLVAQGAQADPAGVAEILGRLNSGAPGLEGSEFVTVRQALELWSVELSPPPPEKLADMARAEKQHFRPVTLADAQQAKARLAAALDALQQRLRPAGPNGADWAKHLQLEGLDAQLRSEKPDMTVLGETYQRFASGHEGLGLIWFADVRDELRHYVELTGAVGNPQLKTAYETILDRSATQLGEYAAKPTTELATDIEESLRWLENALQAPALVRAVRQRHVYPNLFVQVSGPTAVAGINDEVKETTPIQDFILKATVQGTGHTTGRICGSLVPSPYFAVIDATFQGVAQSSTVSVRGPAEVYSSGRTGIGTRTRLWVDSRGVFALPSVSTAATETDISDIDLTRGGRMIERMAWKQAGKKQPKAEAIASQHAEQLANERADQRANEALTRANASFQKKFRQPLLDRRLFPQILQFSTTAESMHVVSLEADAAQLGASTAPPSLAEGADLGLQLHETMANNLASGALGGMTVREQTFQSAMTDLLGKVPDRLKPDNEKEPWAVTFARRLPISVTFANNEIRLSIRGRRYHKAEESYPGMDVTAVYQILRTERGFKLVRQGELAIFPPGFIPGGSMRLSAREIAIRSLLQKRFGKMFDKEVPVEAVTMPGNWAKAGRLEPVQLTAHAGWLTASYRRAPESKAALASK